jgi:hypothetical protein
MPYYTRPSGLQSSLWVCDDSFKLMYQGVIAREPDSVCQTEIPELVHEGRWTAFTFLVGRPQDLPRTRGGLS